MAQHEMRCFYSSGKCQRLRGWFIRRNAVCIGCLRPAAFIANHTTGGEAKSLGAQSPTTPPLADFLLIKF